MKSDVKKTSWHDPIVAEIHLTRERLAEHYHNDLLAYSIAAEAHCRELGLNIVETPLTNSVLLSSTTSLPTIAP